MKLFKILVLALFAIALISCGGAEERKAVYMEKAKLSIAAGDFDKARIELKNVLQIDPKDAEAYYQLGKVYEKQKDYRKAYSHYLKAEDLAPNHLANQAQLGKIYLLLGNDVEKAQSKVDFILSKEPENPDGLLLKSVLLLRGNNVDEAIAISKRVVENDPDFIDGATFLATLYFKNKMPQEAIDVLDKALISNPEDDSLNRLLGLILVNEKDYIRAEDIYKKFLEKFPASRNSYDTLAAFYDTSGDISKSEEVLRASIESDPNDVKRYLTLVKYIRLKKDNDAAIHELKTLISNNKGVGELRMAMGQLLLAVGDKQAAIDVYKKAINDFSEESTGIDAGIALASIYVSDNDIDKASAVVNEALKVSPNDPKVHLLRARIAMFKKDTETAIISLRIVTKEMPRNINAYFLLAGAYQLEGNDEQIKSTLNTAYKSNKDNPRALLKLAQYYLSKDLELAEKITDDYNNLRKSDYDGMAMRAMILNRKKLYSDAYEVAENLIKLFPNKGSGYYHAVPYLVQQGNKKKAISLLEQGYEKAGRNKLLLELLTKLQVSDKNFDAAERRIKDRLSESPADSDLKMMLAKISMAKGDLSSAESHLKEVLAANPAFEEAYLLLAQIYQEQKNVSALKAVLNKGRANVVSSIKIPLRLSAVYESNNEYSNAIKVYRELHELQPENMIIINNLVSMLSDHGDPDDLEFAKKLVVKLEGNEQHVFLDTIGWLYYKLGDYESAIKYLSKAVDQAPKISIFNYHLGMAYKQAGNTVKAKLYLEKSLNGNEAFKESDQAKSALKDL